MLFFFENTLAKFPVHLDTTEINAPDRIFPRSLDDLLGILDQPRRDNFFSHISLRLAAKNGLLTFEAFLQKRQADLTQKRTSP